MAITKYIFDENTDYDAVLEEVKLYLSEQIAIDCGCGCNEGKYCDTIVYITVSDINKVNLDQTRYEESVKAAYYSLDCNC